jgi:hypothetical protein
MQEKQQHIARNTQAQLSTLTEYALQRNVTPQKKTRPVNYSPDKKSLRMFSDQQTAEI